MRKTGFVFILAIILSAASLSSVGLVVSASSPPASSTKLSAEDIYRILKPSVFLVGVYSRDGRSLSSGSCVAVSSNEVVTNKHVVAGGPVVKIEHGKKSWPCKLTDVHPTRDLVKLKVAGVNLHAVPIRNSHTLSIGERVYTIGAPKGLEKTLGDRLVSAEFFHCHDHRAEIFESELKSAF